MLKFVIGLLLTTSVIAKANSIDWSGTYRIEYHEIDRPTLGDDTNKKRKSYGLNSLTLKPKIVASDGVNIRGQFDIFSSEFDAYKNSQVGSTFGSGLNRPLTNNGANVDSQNQESSLLRVSQLYLSVEQENAIFLAGRAPVEFGLGMTHNAGNGEFDHWYDTRDLVAYRFIIDNLSITPMLAKVSNEDFGQGPTTTDQTFIMEYDNKDNGAKAGVFYQVRSGSTGSNDAALYIPVIPGAASVSGGWNTKTVNLFFGRQWTAFEFKVEASFLTGDTGLLSATNENIKFDSYAIAAEAIWPEKEASKWSFMTKFGVASGDNPSTTSVVEGYQMDRNYDVAMLMFNHRMGQRDFLTTGTLHTDPNLSVGNSVDDEAIGNAFYLAPAVKYNYSDRIDIKTTLIYAQMVAKPTLALDTSKDLGTELDIELIYKPRERVTWSNQLGLFMPGDAWKDGASDLDNKFNYGFATKAAITF